MAPTLVATYPVNGTTTGALTTASFTPAAGEVLIVKAITGDESNTIATTAVSGGGLTYTLRGSVGTTDYCTARLWTATVGAYPAAMTVTVTTAGTADNPTLVVERWAGARIASTPAMNAAVTGTAGTTFAPTLTTVGAGSFITWIAGDWTPITTGTPTYRTAAVANHTRRTSGINVWSATQEATTAGAQTMGMTAPTGQKWTLLGIELQAATPLLGTLTETWSGGTIDPVKWSGTYNPAGNTPAAVQLGKVRVYADPGPLYANVESAPAYQIAGSQVRVEVPLVAAVTAGSTGTVQTAVILTAPSAAAGTRLTISQRADLGAIEFRSDVNYDDAAKTTLAYSAATHRWWGIRHTGAEVVFETSADGITWTGRRTITAPAWSTDATQARLTLEAWRDNGAQSYAEFDNINTAGSTAQSLLPPAVDSTYAAGTPAVVAGPVTVAVSAPDQATSAPPPAVTVGVVTVAAPTVPATGGIGTPSLGLPVRVPATPPTTTVGGPALAVGAAQVRVPTLVRSGNSDQSYPSDTLYPSTALFPVGELPTLAVVGATTIAPRPVTLAPTAPPPGTALSAPTVTVGAITRGMPSTAPSGSQGATKVAPQPVTLTAPPVPAGTAVGGATLRVGAVTVTAEGGTSTTVGAVNVANIIRPAAGLENPAIPGPAPTVLVLPARVPLPSTSSTTVGVPVVAVGAVTVRTGTVPRGTVRAPRVAAQPVALAPTAVPPTATVNAPEVAPGAAKVRPAGPRSTAYGRARVAPGPVPLTPVAVPGQAAPTVRVRVGRVVVAVQPIAPTATVGTPALAVHPATVQLTDGPATTEIGRRRLGLVPRPATITHPTATPAATVGAPAVAVQAVTLTPVAGPRATLLGPAVVLRRPITVGATAPAGTSRFGGVVLAPSRVRLDAVPLPVTTAVPAATASPGPVRITATSLVASTQVGVPIARHHRGTGPRPRPGVLHATDQAAALHAYDAQEA